MSGWANAPMTMQSAYMIAIRDRLIKHLDLSRDECGLRPRGTPDPMAGELYIAIWNAGESSNYNAQLQRSPSINITVSVRGGSTPWDRWSDELYVEAHNGLDHWKERILNEIPGGANPNALETMNAANVLVGDREKIQIPLAFMGDGGEEQESGAWWGAQPEQFAGLKLTLRFGGAERIQDASCIIP